MARITGSYPDDLNLFIDRAVEAGVIGGKSDALREFVRQYFEDHDSERLQEYQEVHGRYHLETIRAPVFLLRVRVPVVLELAVG